MNEVDKYKIIFQPSGRRGEVKKGVTILEASRQLGVDIESLCGGKKSCGKCKIRIEEGFFEKYGIQSRKDHAGKWLAEEEKFINREQRAAGFRLGCCARVEGDLLVFVPEESRAGKQIVSKAARDIQIEWNPAVQYYYVELSEPTIQEPTGDLERILEALNHKYGLKDLDIDYLALQRLSNQLRKGEWKVTVAIWMDREILRVLPGRLKDYYGLAVDVGTTTVAAYLCNIATMEVLDTVFMMNPQSRYGEDVMSRITYHMMHQDGLAKMNADIITGLNSLVTQVCKATHPSKKAKKKNVNEKDKPYLRLTPSDIIDMTIVGNTAMHHILLNLNPEYMGIAPFPPVVHKSMDIKARDLGIQINESAYIHVLPNEAGFVGADNVEFLLLKSHTKKMKCSSLLILAPMENWSSGTGKNSYLHLVPLALHLKGHRSHLV